MAKTGFRWSRGSDPRLLRLTMDGYSTAHLGSDPAHQESSRPKVRPTRRFTGAIKVWGQGTTDRLIYINNEWKRSSAECAALHGRVFLPREDVLPPISLCGMHKGFNGMPPSSNQRPFHGLSYMARKSASHAHRFGQPNLFLKGWPVPETYVLYK
jgi:hypothetical protein